MAPGTATRVLSVLGDDRPGIVAELSDVLTAVEGSWLTSQMTRLAGKFAGVVLVQVPTPGLAAFERALAGLRESGLQVTLSEAGEAAPTATWWRASLGVVCQDRPGVVRQLSAALAEHGATIEQLSTSTQEAPMAGGVLFEAEAVLAVPDGVRSEEVQASLEQIAGDLMADVELTSWNAGEDGAPRA